MISYCAAHMACRLLQLIKQIKLSVVLASLKQNVNVDQVQLGKVFVKWTNRKWFGEAIDKLILALD